MRSRRSLATALSLTLAVCAIGTPVALGGSQAVVPPGARATDSPRAGATVVRVSESDAFDWADAGIGVAGGVALSILGAGLVLLAADHRRQPTMQRKDR